MRQATLSCFVSAVNKKINSERTNIDSRDTQSTIKISCWILFTFFFDVFGHSSERAFSTFLFTLHNTQLPLHRITIESRTRISSSTAAAGGEAELSITYLARCFLLQIIFYYASITMGEEILMAFAKIMFWNFDDDKWARDYWITILFDVCAAALDYGFLEFRWRQNHAWVDKYVQFFIIFWDPPPHECLLLIVNLWILFVWASLQSYQNAFTFAPIKPR